MDKKLLGIGIVLLIVGALLSTGSYQATQSIFPNANNTVTAKALLAPHLIAYSPLYLNTTSFVSMGYNSSNTISFYLVNGSAFTRLLPLIDANRSLIGNATALEGKGVFFIVYNQSRGIYPYQTVYGNLFPVPTYQNTNSSVLLSGTYYLIFENDAGANTIVAYSSLAKPASSVSIIASSSAGFGLVGAFLVLAGLVLMVYSFISRRNVQEQLKQEEIDRMYSSIGKTPARKRSGRSGYRTVYRAKDRKR